MVKTAEPIDHDSAYEVWALKRDSETLKTFLRRVERGLATADDVRTVRMVLRSYGLDV